MVKPENSTAVEDYLKAIFSLGEWSEGPISNASLASELGIATSSVSEMTRKLASLGLVKHKRYGGMQLTKRGLSEALQMVRRHRLLETYLVGALGYSWDEVHVEAEVLEHAVSALLIDRMDRELGHPWRDPHGDPIPTADGMLHQPEAWPLAGAEPGRAGFVARIDDDDSALLRWLSEHGIGLDVELRLVEQRPFGGAWAVQIGGRKDNVVDLGTQAVSALWLTDEAPSPEGVGGECHYRACRHIVAARQPELQS